MLRFINNAKNPSQKTTGPLIAIELYNAQRLWIKTAQQEVFAKEYTDLKIKNNNSTSINSSTTPLFKQGLSYLLWGEDTQRTSFAFNKVPLLATKETQAY